MHGLLILQSAMAVMNQGRLYVAAASPSPSPTAVASSVTSELIVHVFQAYDMFLLPLF